MSETYPAALQLPQGTATLVPGMAVYLLNGVPIDVDVEIPEDLAGWVWDGSCLALHLSPTCTYTIHTYLHPPPGSPSDRGSCFDAARDVESRRAKQPKASEKRPKKPGSRLMISRQPEQAALLDAEPAQMALWETT